MIAGGTGGDGLAPPANLLTLWARLLIEGLAESDVDTLVLSPGSRSTPFVVAALGEPRLATVPIVDERDAVFFALGHAKATGRPAAFLCTSGTAVAHALPAVLEADRSATPLLLISADRPPELHHCGAPQTVDQTKLFGDRVRAFFDLGMPEADADRLQALRRTAVQAVWSSRWPRPGPVHVNAPVRKPLEPESEESAPATATTAEGRLLQRIERLRSRPLPRVAVGEPTPDPAELDRLAERIDGRSRVLVVVGAVAPWRSARLAPALGRLAARGLPVAVELASGMRGGVDADYLRSLATLLASRTFRAEPPELVLQVGAAPLSPRWAPWLRESDTELVVLAEHDWSDPTGVARWLLFGSLERSLEGLAERIAQRAPDSQLLALDREVEKRVAELVVEVGWSEAGAVTEAVSALPPGSLLAVGNSLPIRLLEGHGGEPQGPLRVLHQRGVNGIDGLVASFAGALHALRHDPPPVGLLVLGDVSLLHDLGGLATLDAVGGTPTTVLVLDNGGGRIFEQLPLAGRAPYRDDPGALAPWTTPHRRDFAAAARTFGLDHLRVDDRSALRRALDGLGPRQRPLLIEAALPPHGAAILQRRVEALAEELVAERRRRTD